MNSDQEWTACQMRRTFLHPFLLSRTLHFPAREMGYEGRPNQTVAKGKEPLP